MLQREIEHFQSQIVGNANLVDGSATGGEVFNHLRCHARRERRDVLCRDAVIAREYGDQRAIDLWRAFARPCGKPCNNLLQPPERTGGLGQRHLAFANSPFRA